MYNNNTPKMFAEAEHAEAVLKRAKARVMHACHANDVPEKVWRSIDRALFTNRPDIDDTRLRPLPVTGIVLNDDGDEVHFDAHEVTQWLDDAASDAGIPIEVVIASVQHVYVGGKTAQETFDERRAAVDEPLSEIVRLAKRITEATSPLVDDIEETDPFGDPSADFDYSCTGDTFALRRLDDGNYSLHVEGRNEPVTIDVLRAAEIYAGSDATPTPPVNDNRPTTSAAVAEHENRMSRTASTSDARKRLAEALDAQESTYTPGDLRRHLETEARDETLGGTFEERRAKRLDERSQKHVDNAVLTGLVGKQHAPTDEMVEAFRLGWETANRKGYEGRRIEFGLRAVSQLLTP